MPYVAPEDANNRPVDSLEEVKTRNGNPPWRERELATERFRMVVLCWPPGFVYPKHYHPRADEFWLIQEGRIRVSFDEGPAKEAGPGSFLFAKKGTVHEMANIGKDRLIMIAVVIPNEQDDDVFLE
ncbi:MAG: cupin domain-containing protein [Candidatus Bathyarchaeota archaeon]|nr:cupin domain-containing protein [Candidatus Bathyarchaeota archaeon]MDH5686997.1 cupin domain-containing protein [Candidatus Bathyarchaeota archaeon]